MLWLNLHMSVLENEAIGSAENAVLGTWLRLLRYCCVQENGGRIRGAKQWEDRKCRHLLRVDRIDLDQKSELWAWRSHDLVVNYFPASALANTKRLRAQAADAANIRWEKDRATRQAAPVADGMPSGMPAGMRPAMHNGKDKDKGKDKEKGKGKSVPVGTDGRIPTALVEVISFFGSQGAPPELAAKFFNHYSANGWKQGSGLLIQSWHAQGEKWIGDWRAETAKKSAKGAAPASEFDASQPHAHTGGVEVAN